jgi:hypothetical protein
LGFVKTPNYQKDYRGPHIIDQQDPVFDDPVLPEAQPEELGESLAARSLEQASNDSLER